MAGTGDGRLARAFHDSTTHTPSSVRTSTHTLDWDVKPLPFKIYPELPAVPLPRAFDPVAADTLAALGAGGFPPALRLGLEPLAALLYYTAGVTRKRTYPGGGEVHFRAAASTGALYQTEVYVVAGAIDGLPPGLYHFSPADFALRPLRTGDLRGAVAAAAADDTLRSRAATLIVSAIAWRNTWKYQARGYRHFWWDSGTMLANTLATGTALGLAPRLLTGFVDAEVNRLCGLDGGREAVLELVVLGPSVAPAPPLAAADLPEIRHPTVPLSSSEVDYPALRELHAASMLDSPAAVEAWRRGPPPPPRDARGPVAELPPPAFAAGRALGDTIQHRGSTRRFSRAPLSVAELSTLLSWASRETDLDVVGGFTDLYLIVNAVDGIAPGAYVYRRERHGLERLAAGDFRRQSGYLCLEQPLGADAAAVIYFLAPLDALLVAFGDRGYRLANLEAGLIGGRAYLAAYAQGFGASGLTFYDREVVGFFSPHAEGLDAVFVTALGRAARGLA